MSNIIGDLFVTKENLYVLRDSTIYKYDKTHSKIQEVNCNPNCSQNSIKQIGDKIFFLKNNGIKKLDENWLEIDKKELNGLNEELLDFHVYGDKTYVVKQENDRKCILLDGTTILQVDSKCWFFEDSIYYTEHNTLYKFTDGKIETVKKNVIPSILEVFSDLMVIVSHGFIVYIISKDINLTFHKHSSNILAVCRVDSYLYFVSKDNKLSVAEISRENRKFVLNFLGEFKKLVYFNNMIYILTDVELVQFDTVKSKIYNYTFEIPTNLKPKEIKDVEDEYFELVSLAYKEKKVKRTIEPFYKILNENKYKVEERVYDRVPSSMNITSGSDIDIPSGIPS
ncbi:hypothetical protein NGRA_0312, partial [Nosema granulosis]